MSTHPGMTGATGLASQKSQRELEFEAGQKAAARHGGVSPSVPPTKTSGPNNVFQFPPIHTGLAEAAGVGTPTSAEQQSERRPATGPTGPTERPSATGAATTGSTGPTGRIGATAANDDQGSGTSPQGSETLEAAKSYIRADWHVFPGKRREKTPKPGWSWTKAKLTLADAPKYFDKDQHNVLVALGKASNNVVDVDLDWVEATAAADVLLPGFPSFGRSGKPRSHRVVICADIKTRKYSLPQSLANHLKVGNGEHATCIAEIRSSGAYTVFPGSEHETGQKVEWTDASTDSFAIPAIDTKKLFNVMGLLSFIAFCMRFFPAVGVRCDFMMAVAGALAHAGYEGDMIQQVVQCIGVFNHDEGDSGTWRVAADCVGQKVEDDKAVTGLPTLIKILGLGDDVLKWCREMLGTTRDVTGGKWPGGENEETGKPKRGILNTIEAIKRLGITCTWDEFRQKEYWSGHADKKFDGDVQDAAVTVTRVNICAKFRLYPRVEETREAITYACRANKSNPVLHYFNGLKWDGKSRLDKMLHNYLGADDTLLNGAIGCKTMCAIVRRAKQPGCKFDAQLVLQGPQGIRKSMFCEDLAVFPDLYTDAGDLSGTIKEQMEIIQGKQIIEFPELAGYSRASREHNKAMLSRKIDRARLSYAHYATDAPRQSIPVATTNEDHYLNDPTGERRSWHSAVSGYKREAFLADKDQLYAEAVVREPTENLWLDTPDLAKAHDAIVAGAKEPNELIDLLRDLHGEVWHVNGRDEERVSAQNIRNMLGMTTADAARSHNIGRRILDAMKVLGWRKALGTIRCHKDHDPTTGYTRPLPFGPQDGTLTLLPVQSAEEVGEPTEGDAAVDKHTTAVTQGNLARGRTGPTGATGATGAAGAPAKAGPGPTGPAGPASAACVTSGATLDRLLVQGMAKAQADLALVRGNS